MVSHKTCTRPFLFDNFSVYAEKSLKRHIKQGTDVLCHCDSYFQFSTTLSLKTFIKHNTCFFLINVFLLIRIVQYLLASKPEVSERCYQPMDSLTFLAIIRIIIMSTVSINCLMVQYIPFVNIFRHQSHVRYNIIWKSKCLENV